jgi:chorismate synthase
MHNNTLGDIFTVTSFGESHGVAVGCVIDGMPAGYAIDEVLIQQAVNYRKTGTTNYTSARHEDDAIEILSGIYEGKTLGSPIAIIIKNKDAQSKDYDAIKDVYRPSHADYTYAAKYGIRDHRGGGRSSIRIAAPMVAAGEIAHQILLQNLGLEIKAHVASIGTITAAEESLIVLSQEEIYQQDFRCADKQAQTAMQAQVDDAMNTGDTLGGSISCIINNLPAGLGSPIFSKLQARLAQAMLSINTVKSFEFGSGKTASTMTGSAHNDAFVFTENSVQTSSNNSGGIQGGISNGMPINFTIHFKPISSIKHAQQSIDINNQNTEIKIEGRHDVCAVPRAVPIVLAYTQIILLDEFLKQNINKK